MQTAFNYRGRFAPSPTGSLHFGSLVTAIGSYLETRQHDGTWLVRMEDLDTTRNVPGAADDILYTLECFGLHSDQAVIYQSQRTEVYRESLQILQDSGMVYPCVCSRKEIADSAINGIDGQIYPGTCRNGFEQGRLARSWRVRTDARVIEVNDAVQGRIAQSLENQVGDFVVLRSDGLFAYQLAVVVDDAVQGITHIVRGADLLASTPRQIYLQRLLGFITPAYTHLPIAVNTQGEKLSKQTLAPPVDIRQPAALLLRALAFLHQQPPAELAGYDLATIWNWALANWDVSKLHGVRTVTAD